MTIQNIAEITVDGYPVTALAISPEGLEIYLTHEARPVAGRKVKVPANVPTISDGRRGQLTPGTVTASEGLDWQPAIILHNMPDGTWQLDLSHPEGATIFDNTTGADPLAGWQQPPPGGEQTLGSMIIEAWRYTHQAIRIRFSDPPFYPYPVTMRGELMITQGAATSGLFVFEVPNPEE